MPPARHNGARSALRDDDAARFTRAPAKLIEVTGITTGTPQMSGRTKSRRVRESADHFAGDSNGYRRSAPSFLRYFGEKVPGRCHAPSRARAIAQTPRGFKNIFARLRFGASSRHQLGRRRVDQAATSSLHIQPFRRQRARWGFLATTATQPSAIGEPPHASRIGRHA